MYSDSGDGNIPLVKNREIVRKQVAFTWKNNKNEREKYFTDDKKRQYGTNKCMHGQHNVSRYYGQQTDSMDNTDVSKDSMYNTVLAKKKQDHATESMNNTGPE
jgi:hypothetical protein